VGGGGGGLFVVVLKAAHGGGEGLDLHLQRVVVGARVAQLLCQVCGGRGVGGVECFGLGEGRWVEV